MYNIAMAVALIFFAIGIIGTILPMLPGSVMVFAGMVIYGFMTGFESLGIYFFILEFIVLLITFLIDFVATAASTRKYGGSKKASIGAVIGTLIGLVFLGPLGIIIGPFFGASAAELLSGTDINQAVRAGFGSLVGVLGGTIIKLGAEALMIVYFFMNI